MNLKDQYTILQIRKGSIKAFEEVFRENYSGMVKYSASVLKNEEQAKEIVQDIFYSIWKNRKELKIKALHAYLYRSAFNNSLMALRRNRREVRMEPEMLREGESENPDPQDLLDEKETYDRILDILDKLPEKTRKIFIMSRFEGLKYEEIATALSISVKTVEANMSKALKALRSLLLNDDNTFRI